MSCLNKSANSYPTASSLNPNDTSTGKSRCSANKDNFINQAHEARLEREYARRTNLAATKIQSIFKTIIVKKKQKDQTIKLITDLVNSTNLDLDGFFHVSRRALLYCDQVRDKTQFDSIFLILIRIIEGNIDFFASIYTDQVKFSCILRLIKICESYLCTTNQTRVTNQNMLQYFSLLGHLTNQSSWKSGINAYTDKQIKEKIKVESDDIMIDTLVNRIILKFLSYDTTSIAICKYMSSILTAQFDKLDDDLKTAILLNYVAITVTILDIIKDIENNPSNCKLSENPLMIDIVRNFFCVPALITNLLKHYPEFIDIFNKHSFLKHSTETMLTDSSFNQLKASTLLYIIGNVIHLAYISIDKVNDLMIPLTNLLTRLMEACCKYSVAPIKKNKNDSTKSESKTNENIRKTDVALNPILGWFERDTMLNGKAVKTQISHLWSSDLIKLFFSDLSSRRLNSQSEIVSDRSFSSKKYLDKSKNIDNQKKGPITTIRKVAERLASNVTIGLNSPYLKNSSYSLNGGLQKLISAENSRIAHVCCMYHTSIKTLVKLTDDIKTKLCLDVSLLKNLWVYICSLGPNNGVKVYLDHLAIYTKTSSPEFHILTLFCECSSHLINSLDDLELYEKQKSFSIDDLIAISSFLNTFVFKIIWNNLIPNVMSANCDPLFNAAHVLLTDLYKRDCRRPFAPPDHWLIKDIRISSFLKDLDAARPIAKAIITLIPHAIPHRERVVIFRKLVSQDKARQCVSSSTLITVHRSRIVENGYQQLVRLPPSALKGLIRVKFVNDQGLDEAGIDQDGVFKEFLEDTIKKVFDPALNLFCLTSEHCLYPSPTSRLHEDHLSLFNFVGKMLGKAVYEGIVVDVPFALFFLSRVLGHRNNHLYSPIDELPSLDPELYKSLTYIKNYEGDVSELDLTFSIDQDFLGKIETHELQPGGKYLAVTNESRLRYIHRVATYRMCTQIEKQIRAFVSGFRSLIEPSWLMMFSASEFQRLISGDNTPIDLVDLRKNTKYFGGFHNNHRVVCWLWDILEKDFTSEELKLFLKFITSCSKPPLLGFSNLEPPFSIRCVEVSDDQDSGDTVISVLRGFFAIRRSDPVDRLPTSSTCFNLLKLPNYQRRSTLREKLRYAIKCNPGFELS